MHASLGHDGCMDSRQRARAESQLQVLDLLEAAMGRRDEVFEIVDSSEDDDEARERIRELFGVRQPHIAQSVLDLPVSQWSRSGRQRIAQQAEELRRELNG